MTLYNIPNGNFKLMASIEEEYFTPYEENGQSGSPILIGYNIVFTDNSVIGIPITNQLDRYKTKHVTNMIYSDTDDLKTITIKVKA